MMHPHRAHSRRHPTAIATAILPGTPHPQPHCSRFAPTAATTLGRLLLDRFELADPRHLVGHRLAACLGPLGVGVGVGQRGGGLG